MQFQHPQIVARERVKLEGVTYQVVVVANEDGFRGKWTCTACNQQGESAVNSAGKAAALCWAKDGLGVHHAATHVRDFDM